MDAASFQERWIEADRRTGALDEQAFVHFRGVTLPDAAAPFLSFHRAGAPKRLWEVYGIREQWPEAERDAVRPFLVIGDDGCGNPLAVADGTGAVWMLDHEDGYRTRQFVNSSVARLAECLLAFQKVFAGAGADAVLAAMRAVDPHAVDGEPLHFWDEAVDAWFASREH